MINLLKHPCTSAPIWFGFLFKYVPTWNSKWKGKKSRRNGIHIAMCLRIEFCREKSAARRTAITRGDWGTAVVIRDSFSALSAICDIVPAGKMFHAIWNFQQLHFVPGSFIHLRVFSAVKFLNLCAPSLCQCRVTVADIVVGTSSLISKRAYELHMPLNSAASVCAVYAVCYVYLILSARPCHYLI